MKRKTIITSVLVIVLCLGLISGSTFALFTSEDSVNIAITSGKVNVVATIDAETLKVYSATVTPNDSNAVEAGTLTGTFAGTYYYDSMSVVNNVGTFANGGTATLTDDKTLTIDKITPGDKVTLSVKVENNSNVKTKYRIRVNVLDGETLKDAADSLKLFEGLVVKVGTDNETTRTATALNGVIRVSDWYSLAARETNSEDNLADVPVEVYLPLEAGNEYQELKTEIQITVEAVQDNAATNTELEAINAYLAAQQPKSATMYEAINSLVNASITGLTTLTSYESAFEKVESYLWNVDTNQFYSEGNATDFAYKYFKVYNSMPATQTYSIYAGSSWTATSVTGLTVGFDAGATTGITTVTYDRSTALYGQEVVIRTNDVGTELTVNAPKDVIRHYGIAGSSNIIAAANSSYHEFGIVAFIEIGKGRLALEENSNVSQIHINSVKDDNGDTTNEFAEIIVSIAEAITTQNKPVFSRDDVEIAQSGTLVVAIQNGTEDLTEDTELDYVWLTKQGIFEQIKVSDSNEEIKATDKWADDNNVNDKTQVSAFEIANNIKRDDNGAIDVEVTIDNTKTYQVALTENRDLVVYESNSTSTEPVATLSIVGEVTIGEVEYTIALTNNTSNSNNTTELVVTNANTSESTTTSVVETSGLDEDEKENAKNDVVEEVATEHLADDNFAAKIIGKSIGYDTLQEAIDKAEDGDVVKLLNDTTETISISGKTLTLDLNENTITAGAKAYAITVYDTDAVTIKNGIVNGQIRIGEHQYTIVKWQYKDNYPLYGYHPLMPAKSVILKDLDVNTTDVPVLYFTNIEDDLTRANESNKFDQDLYGRYVYKTGYQTYDQSTYHLVDEVFTACSDKDNVTVINCNFSSNSTMTGKMYDINNNLYTDVLEVVSGTFANDTIGRFVKAEKYLVGSSSNVYTVMNDSPDSYTARINNIYYTFEGGANCAINYSNFGETVYMKENASAQKVFGEDEDGNPDKLYIVYEAENISYTGGVPKNPTYEIHVDIENNVNTFYSKFEPVAAVYATSQGGSWTNATKIGEYATLQDAINAIGQNYTVLILRDFTVGDETTYKYGGVNYKCAAGFATRATIDFNGHRITYTGTGSCIFSSQQTGYLYFKDSSGTNAGGITATNTNAYCIRKQNSKSDYTYFYGGTYISEKSYALYLNQGTGITIYGGVYISNRSNGQSLYRGSVSTLTLSGGTYSYSPNANWIASGKSIVDNGNGTYTVK